MESRLRADASKRNQLEVGKLANKPLQLFDVDVLNRISPALSLRHAQRAAEIAPAGRLDVEFQDFGEVKPHALSSQLGLRRNRLAQS